MADDHSRLIEQYLDGILAPEDVPALDDALLHDDTAVERLTRLSELDFLLTEEFADDEAQRQGEQLLAAAGDSPRPPAGLTACASNLISVSNLHDQLRWATKFVTQPKPLSLIVAASVMLLLIGTMAYVGAPIYLRMTQSPALNPPVFVGRVTGVFDAEWKGFQIGGALGSYVPQGHSFALRSGVIEVTLERGARVIAQGPAVIAFPGNNRAKLNHGKAVAHVPQAARGFSIDAPQAKVVDLGTSFGIASTGPDSQLFIEVFEGMIEVHPVKGVDTAPFLMHMGERVALRDEGAPMPELQPEFIRDVPGSSQGPAVLVGFYQFEGNAHDDSGNMLHGRQVSDVAWTEGYEGQGATFAGVTSSFIDLPIDANGEQMPILTWGAWVKPTVVAQRNTILSTDNGGFDRTLTIDERTGYESKELFRFCAHGGVVAGELPSSSDVLPAAEKWSFVAVEYNAPAKTVTLFVENEFGQLHRDTFYDALPAEGLPYVRVGMNADGMSEPFSGTIDNVFLFRGRLDPNQLLTIHRGGASAILKIGAEFAPRRNPADDGS